MAPNKDMIEAFVGGRLSADDHELMVHHISSCTECAAAVIAALAEAARAPTTEANERSVPAMVATDLPYGDATPATAADLHQLDLILDSTSSHTASLLLRPEQVPEVELGSLPAYYPPPRELTALRADVSAPGNVPPLVEAVVAAHDAALEEADTEVIASATAARVADSAAHGAVVLAAEVSEFEEDGEQERAERSVEEELPAVMTEVAVPFAIASEVPFPPAIAPATPVEDRVPEPERATIAAAVRRNAEDAAAPRGRWAGGVGTIAALLIFTGLAAYGATQLRSFASMESSREPSTHVASAEATAPSSVLEPVFDAPAFGGILDFPPPVDEPGGDEGGSETEEPTRAGKAGVTAGQPAPPATVQQPAARGRTSIAATRRAPQRSKGIVPQSASAARLLRTTTHRVRPDVDYVLREYDAAAPAPSPREGVSEYRWSDAGTSRLYVLSGAVAVAELRSYARRLQNGGQR